MKTSNTLVLVGGAILAYFLYKKATAATAAVGQAYNTSVNTVSDALSAFFGPAVTLSSIYYTTTFPDGSTHAVPGNSVDSAGNFIWTGYPAGSLPGAQYQLMVGSDGTKYAVSGG